jgi:predicted acetyltransferase
MVEVYDYNLVKPLFKEWQHDMVLQSVEIGNTKPRIWVDCISNPTCAMLLVGIRMRIIGFPKTDECRNSVIDFFQNNVFKNSIEQIKNEIVLYWFESEWEQLLIEIFKGKNIWFSDREYYIGNIDDIVDDKESNIDFEIKDAIEVVLENKFYKNINFLKEEMGSETTGIADFVKKSFGICAIKDNIIIGWCLSEYNNPIGCEIGVGVIEEYRRKGIATILCKKLIKEAQKRHLQVIGWSSFKNNICSVKTALKIGLKKVKEYQ